MAEVAIITASYGGYDSLKPIVPQVGIDAEWVVVSDDPGVANGTDWRLVHEPKLTGVSDFRAAKRAKCFPWLYTDARYSIWIDGSIIVESEHFAAAAVSLANPIAQFDHPGNCIYQEAATSLKLQKYRAERPLITEQCFHYSAKGHPHNWGLWATTVIARKHTRKIRRLGLNWYKEIKYWSSQDQISEPYVLRNLNLRPAILPGDVQGKNPWLTYAPSERHLNPNPVLPYLFWEDLRS